jgi:hypothetical protein
MKAHQDMERVYELLEQIDFTELADMDKKYVLSMMTEKEYVQMRNTLKDVEQSLSGSEELVVSDLVFSSLMNKPRKSNSVLKLLMMPVQIYKVAAMVLLILGLYTVIQLSFFPEKKNTLALNDTLNIHKTDTVYTRLVDTVKIIKEKIIYVSQGKENLKPVKLLTNSGFLFDSTKEICPEDIDRIKELASNNPFYRDTLIRD